MNKDQAKLIAVKHALHMMNARQRLFSHKDLFHPGDWNDNKPVADVAAQRAWQKSVLQTVVDLGILKRTVGDEAGSGYEVMDPDAARSLAGDDEALYWLLAPREFEPPGWIHARMPKAALDGDFTPTSKTVTREEHEEVVETFVGLLKMVSAQLTAIQASYRRMEDKVNKLDFRAVEARDKTLQLVASAISDLRQCSTEMRSSVEECEKLSLDMISSQDAFIQKIDTLVHSMTTTLRMDRDELVSALNLHERYSHMMGEAQSIVGVVTTAKAAFDTIYKSATSLDASVETAMELAREVEERHHVTR